MFSIWVMFFKLDFANMIIVPSFVGLIFNFHILALILILNSGGLMLIIGFGVIIIWFCPGQIKRLMSLLLFEFDVFLEEGVDLLIKKDILSIVFLKEVLHFENLVNIVEGISFMIYEFVHLRSLFQIVDKLIY